MKPLIDLDMLLYEVASIGEWPKDEPIKSFDYVKEIMDGKIKFIYEAVGGDEPPMLFLTGPTNFRNDVAKQKGYKISRKDKVKPFHHANLKAYCQAAYDCFQMEGLEADDLMSIVQTKESSTVICTRDKDLRQVPGWHYGWECGKQPEFKLQLVDEEGSIELAGNRKSIKGTGMWFFYSQLLTGDVTDDIPGIDGVGAVKAYTLLSPCENLLDAFSVIVAEYAEAYGDDWEAMLTEQGQLLWMVRELDDDNQPVMWSIG